MFSLYLPQWPVVSHSALVEEQRRLDLHVAVLAASSWRMHVDERRGRARCPSGVQNAAPGANGMEVEEVELLAELAVVALLRLLERFRYASSAFLSKNAVP